MGDLVRFNPSRSQGYPSSLTEGKAYTVIEYDPNDRGWPDGCCGTPFVTINDDHGKPFFAFAYRFERTDGHVTAPANEPVPAD